jgi:hypothetical protein
MFLHIHDNRTLKELQLDFSGYFPYLKLEFFSKPHRRGVASTEKNKRNPFLQIVSIRTHHRNGAVEIRENQTAYEVEQLLQKEYFLPAQIYHYTTAGWIVTDVADTATLKELNEQGRRSAHEENKVYAQTKQLK